MTRTYRFMSFMTMFYSSTSIYNTKTFAPSRHDYLKMTKNQFKLSKFSNSSKTCLLPLHPPNNPSQNIYKRKRQNNESTIQPTIFVKQSSREHTYTWKKKEHKCTSPVDTHTHLALNSSKTEVG